MVDGKVIVMKKLFLPRGLSEDNPNARNNWLKLTPWMGAADALYAH